jgi:hypothetical protein
MAYEAKANEQAIQIDGLSECFKALRAVGVPIEAIKEANRESGELVARSARNTANFKGGTGALRRTIRVANVSTNVKIRAGNARTPYANPIHWGWFRDKVRGFNRNIKPNPFMAKALGYTRDEVLANYVTNIQKLIKKHEPTSADLRK